MAYQKIPKELHKTRGPKPMEEVGKAYRVWLKPSQADKIKSRYGTLTTAITKQYELDNKKDEKLKSKIL